MYVVSMSRTTVNAALRGSQLDYYVTPPARVAKDLYLCLTSLRPNFVKLLLRFFKKAGRGYGLKFQLRCNCFLEKFVFETNKEISLDVWFPADTYTVLNLGILKRQLDAAYRDIEKRFDAFVGVGSGWVMKRVLKFCLSVNRFKIFQGGCSKSTMPGSLRKRRCCLSIKRVDESDGTCFRDCMVAGIAGVRRNPSRWCALYNEIEALLLKCWPKGCDFPISSRHWPRIDKHSPVSVSVYGYDKGHVFPLFLTTRRECKPFHVDLLLCRGHYYLIRNLSALIAPQMKLNRRKSFICPSCLSSHVSPEKLRAHISLCRNDCVMYRFPDAANSSLQFNSFNNMVTAPFVIYCDMETYIQKEVVVQKAKTLTKRRHVPISVAAFTVCRDRLDLGSKPFIYTGVNCLDVFMHYLDEEVYRLKDVYERLYLPCRWTGNEKEMHDRAETCAMCGRNFEESQLMKVRDHCHISGRYRFPLCSLCNLTRAKRRFEVLVIFHGLRNYDSHFLIRKLSTCPLRNINVIPKNSEQYLSFSYGCLHFKDSYAFLASSLSTLVDNLKTKGMKQFRHLRRFITNPKERDLLTGKGVFPYSYVHDPGVLLETQLPGIDKFYNDLDCSDLTPERYEFAQRVWKTFKCQNLKDYLHVYLLADCLLLADVFEHYRGCCLADYRLDPIHYFSSSHYTFDAFLLHTQSRLELLTDLDHYLFLSKAMRGGLSIVSKRYSRANHPSLGEKYDSSKPLKFLHFVDANNLYGKVMMEYLPVGGFRWMKREELTEEFVCALSADGDYGCFVQCTMLYPPALHDLHDDYPLAPVKRKIRYEDLSPVAREMCDRHKLKGTLNREKLIGTFEVRREYVLHYRNLQFYLKLGMRVVEFQAGLIFRQAPVMKSYIEFNSQRRCCAENKFDIDYYKFMMNSLFGKTIENPEKRTKVKLCRTRKELEKTVGKTTFKRSKIIDPHLVGVETRYPYVKLNKPYYIGLTILELSKLHMYDFHYNTMKKLFGSDLRLLYTDTDSLLYEIDNCADPYLRVCESGVQDRFDFSNFPTSHPLHDASVKRVPGKFKDECNELYIYEFVGLRSKMYSLKFGDDSSVVKTESKVAKGVKGSVIRKSLNFSDYLRCLHENEVMEHSFKTIKSISHDVHTFHQRKVSLSSFDDKRFLLDHIHSLPYGHHSLENAQFELKEEEE